MSKEAKITLVELPPTNFGKLDGDRAQDVYCQVRLPARATPLLHAVLEKAGYINVVSIDPQYNPVPNRLNAQDWVKVRDSEYLLLSAITRLFLKQQSWLGNTEALILKEKLLLVEHMLLFHRMNVWNLQM